MGRHNDGGPGYRKKASGLPDRGRNPRYRGPPAQIPACGTTALGSYLESNAKPLARVLMHPIGPLHVSGRSHFSHEPDAVFGPCCDLSDFSWSTPFPPPAPLAHLCLCSLASQVLWGRQTSRWRSSTPCPIGSCRVPHRPSGEDTIGISRFPRRRLQYVHRVYDRAGTARISHSDPGRVAFRVEGRRRLPKCVLSRLNCPARTSPVNA